MSDIRPGKINRPIEKTDISTQISNFLWDFGSWLTEEDKSSDVIISSRIRLARNIEGYRFPNRARQEDLKKILKQVKKACTKCQSLRKPSYFETQEFSEWDGKYFIERRLASPQLVKKDKPAMLVIAERESLCVMVNEEDHLRIQCIAPGLRIEDAWQKISNIEDELQESLTFSYSNKYGYLTSCPTNIGTGMRVSFFVHIPALSMQDRIDEVLDKIPMPEIAVRGFYGEGTDSIGGIFQISNQLTLGRTETSVLEGMKATAEKLISAERVAREKSLDEKRIKLEDAVYRALGTLQNARMVTSLEAVNLLSTLRFGRELGMIEKVSRLGINQMLMLVQPAHLQKIYSEDLTPEDRDIVRADFIRENLQL